MPAPWKEDPFAFWLNFVCGAVLGGLGGLYTWARPWMGMYGSWMACIGCVVSGALIGGLAAGFGKDRFWKFPWRWW